MGLCVEQIATTVFVCGCCRTHTLTTTTGQAQCAAYLGTGAAKAVDYISQAAKVTFESVRVCFLSCVLFHKVHLGMFMLMLLLCSNRLRDAEGGSSFTVLDGGGKGGDEYDPGFSEMQVCDMLRRCCACR